MTDTPRELVLIGNIHSNFAEELPIGYTFSFLNKNVFYLAALGCVENLKFQ